jgi:plastocyanin
MNRKHMLLAAGAVFSITVQAATVQITVLARDGQPLPNAVVVIEPAGGTRPAAPAPVQATIAQEKMQFVPMVSVLPVGSRVTFVNQDAWEHHVRGVPAGLAGLGGNAAGIELRLAGRVDGKAPSSAEVTLSTPGALQLGCHLHGSMRGFVYVTDSPFAVQTDANGVASLRDVPEGTASVRVWHSDQLLEGKATEVNITPVTAVSVPTQVAPRRRRL